MSLSEFAGIVARLLEDHPEILSGEYLLRNMVTQAIHRALGTTIKRSNVVDAVSENVVGAIADEIMADKSLLRDAVLPNDRFYARVRTLFDRLETLSPRPNGLHLRGQEIFEGPLVERALSAPAVISVAPSLLVLKRIADRQLSHDQLHWRAFEELVAELLERDGYTVKLGPGRNDGNVDIVALKNIPGIGPIKSIWQAKKYGPDHKIGVGVIRELADTRQMVGANKGIIVTTTFLTQGALERIRRDEYTLGKVDAKDLSTWIDRVLWGR